MEKTFKFKKNDYVRVKADRYNIFNGLVDDCRTLNNNKTYKVCGKWYFEDTLEKAKKPCMTPTEDEMVLIKKEYPILKKDNIKIIFEHGQGIFGFIYEKGDQRGKLRYTKGEFSVMSDKEARQYGYVF